MTNLGTTDDEILKLEIADDSSAIGQASYFKLDTTVYVKRGDILLKENEQPLKQRIHFYPKEERRYETRLILTTKSGGSAMAILSGTGVEARGAIDSADFGTVHFTGPSTPTTGTPPVRKQVLLHALPTGMLRITGIEIQGDTTAFVVPPEQFVNERTLPWELLPGDTMTVDVEFRPQSPGLHNAKIAFVGNHSHCIDSTAVLTGRASTSSSVEEIPDISHAGMRITCIPNPVRSTAHIRATFMQHTAARIEIFDEAGNLARSLVEQEFAAGDHVVEWDGTDNAGGHCANGMYACRLTAGERTVWTWVVLKR